MLGNARFIEDGVLAGTKSAVPREMHLIVEVGPPLGNFIYLVKYELFSPKDMSSTFLEVIGCSHACATFGALIGNILFCPKLIASRHKIASKLLS